MKVPPAPVVASALSGFVVGVLVTLLASGITTEDQRARPALATLPPATPEADTQMYASIRRIALRQLGPGYPNEKASRVLSIQLSPPLPEVVGPVRPEALRRFRSVAIGFRLNDHPLGRSWRLRAARADVFSLLKALYTSQLPIYDVELDGYFPVKTKRGTRDKQVVMAYINRNVASKIPWKRWGRVDESRLWSSLSYTWVSPIFA